MPTIKTIDGHKMDTNAVAELMDNEIREQLHNEFADEITEQEFYEKYCKAHKEKFGEDFIVN